MREIYGVTSQTNLVISEDMPLTLPEVAGDRQCLKQATFTLLDSTIKSSDKGGRISYEG